MAKLTWALSGGLASALVLAACSNTPPAGSNSGTTTAPTGRPHPTTTTTTLPNAPLSSGEAAANALVADWAQGNRTSALGVATPSAVTALFAIPYPPSGDAINRGCTTGSAPVTCTFGPNGGANPNLPIYSLTVLQEPSGGWYVSAAQQQG
jgi:hypothetical protein